MRKLITRIAPSPTGNLHIGTARTAYLNWLAAKSTGGRFVLRIDDTDIDTSDPIYTTNIIDSLDWLGLDYDVRVDSSDRSDIYKDYLDRIDPKYLIKDDGCVRLSIPTDMIRDNWKDSLGRRPIKTSDFDRNSISNMVLIKSNGLPTYNFQSVVDDIDLDINCIIRGTDHIGNTLKQITLFDLLNKEIPDFYHVGLIHNMQGKKLSKRDGDMSITEYKNTGYSKDALLNFILRIGWSPRDPNMNGIIDQDMALNMFWDSGKMSNSSAKMDLDKLDWYNRKYNNIDTGE